eukprot:m.129031 g.129031  ORF g.129031 m.129031 type:complete len:638 (-) comp13650_c0_seq8:1856-3769(-)
MSAATAFARSGGERQLQLQELTEELEDHLDEVSVIGDSDADLDSQFGGDLEDQAIAEAERQVLVNGSCMPIEPLLSDDDDDVGRTDSVETLDREADRPARGRDWGADGAESDGTAVPSDDDEGEDLDSDDVSEFRISVPTIGAPLSPPMQSTPIRGGNVFGGGGDSGLSTREEFGRAVRTQSGRGIAEPPPRRPRTSRGLVQTAPAGLGSRRSDAPGLHHITTLAPAPPSIEGVIELGMAVYWGSGHGVAGGVEAADLVPESQLAQVAEAYRRTPVKDPEVALWLSTQHLARGNPLKSQEVLEEVLGEMMKMGTDQAAAGPVLFDCLYNCAAAMSADGLFDEAAHEWAELIDVALDGDLVARSGLSASAQRRFLFEGIANRAWCLLALGTPEAAIESFEQYLDVLDEDVKSLTDAEQGLGSDPAPVALCLYVLGRAYLAAGQHHLANELFMGAADVHKATPNLWGVLMVWATVAAHAAAPPIVGGAGRHGRPEMAEWLMAAVQANIRNADDVLTAAAHTPGVPVEWVGVVCHQAAYSCWLLDWMEPAESWIMRGIEGMGSVEGEETFRLLLLTAQFFEGHPDKVEQEVRFLRKLLQIADRLGKDDYVAAISDEIVAHAVANDLSTTMPPGGLRSHAA